MTDVAQMPLKTLGLRTGMALQTRRLVEGTSKKESQFFGAIEGKGVMVGPLGSESDQTGLEAGEICVVRGFTGQYEFSFVSKVLQTFEKPFVYALLAYPAHVDARLVRQSMRTKTAWPTRVHPAPGPNGSAPAAIEVALVDISLSGAMISAPSPLAAVGDMLTLGIDVKVEDETVHLLLPASICHCNKAGLTDTFFIGLAFKNLKQYDKLVLHYATQSPTN